jgi:ribosomal protein S27AE
VAEGRRLVCTHCGFAVDAWSDGNPYYRDERGKKRYAYHPDHAELERCIGNDVPHLCLACGAQTMVDSEKPRTTCRKCKTGVLADLWVLDEKPCPKCHAGVFQEDPEGRMVS